MEDRATQQQLLLADPRRSLRSGGTGIISSGFGPRRAQMGEAFLRKQPWPHLDGAIAEAGKQLMDSDVFSTPVNCCLYKKSSCQGWACQPGGSGAVLPRASPEQC